jgi:hypothetical protein
MTLEVGYEICHKWDRQPAGPVATLVLPLRSPQADQVTTDPICSDYRGGSVYRLLFMLKRTHWT